MKKRVISLLMAVVFILTASVCSMSVMAASEPLMIIDDFEDYAGGKPASALWEHNASKLTKGTDVTYGTYLYHNGNSRLDFGFTNAVTSGKVYLGADIKFAKLDSGDFALTLAKTGSTLATWTNITGYYASNNDDIKAIHDGNWHTLEVIMDVTGKRVSFYIDGVEKDSGVNNDLADGLQFVRFQETTDAFCLDNLRLIASDGDVFEMYVENASDDENGAVTLDFTRSVKNINSLTTANVIIKEVMTGTTLDVTNVTPVGNLRLNVEFDNADAVAGAEYAVTVNNAELALETPISLTAMFNTQGGDKIDTVLYDPINNFAGLGAANDWSVYTYRSNGIYQQEATYSTMSEATTEGMKITLPQWTDNQYRSIFAIKNEFDNVIEPKGVITVEMRIYNDNMYELYPILYGTDTNGDTTTAVWTRLGGFNKTPGFVGYTSQDKPDDGNYRPWLSSASFDAWHTIITEFDFDNNVARYKYDDGEWITSVSGFNMQISNYNNVTKSTFGGFEGIAIVSNAWLGDESGAVDGSYTVDYVNVTQALPNPVISKVRFVDYEGNEVLPNDTIDAEIDTVKVYFSTTVATSTLANAVTLTGINAPTVTYNSYDATTNCATYKLSDYLMGGKTYTLTITDDVTDADGNNITNAGAMALSTNAGKLIIKGFGFDKADLTGVAEDDVINLSVDIINTKGDGKDAQLSYGVYNDKLMNGFNYLPVEMDDTKATYEKSLPITVKDLNKLTIKGFLWDSFETIRPLIDDCSLTNVAD